MNVVATYFRDLGRGIVTGWNRFWFTPTDPATLSLIRVLAGAMLLYTHLVWTIGLDDFFGPSGWLSAEAVRSYQGDTPFIWSYLWLLESRAALWIAHAAALVVFALLMLGVYTRVVSVLAYLITVAYVNRVPGSLFGLDQINGLLAMYLMLGPSGARYSLDRWFAKRATPKLPDVSPSIGANIAIRLIQLHMCVIYFFAGISKLQGPSWWNGSALWGAVGNLEYQSIDMTWLAHWPLIVAGMTHITILWELTYSALIWPKLTRPIVLALAIPLHLGIGLFLGMPTFGTIMLVGNLAFVTPWLVRTIIERKQPDSRPLRTEEHEASVPKRPRKVRPAQASAVAANIATR